MKRAAILRIFFFSFLVLFLSARPASAQSTVVTATISDPSGQVYQFGTRQGSIACPGNQQPTFNGSPLTRTIPISGLDGNGTFTQSFWDVNAVGFAPPGCGWKFSICDRSGAFCFTTPSITTVTGAAVNLSSTISSYAVLLPVTSLAQFLGLANTWTKAQTFGAGITGTGSIGSLTAPYNNLTGFPSACGANLFATQIAATPGCTQPAFSNLTGTIASAQFGSQSANTFLAAPNGSAGNPTFRAMVGADLPATTGQCTGVQFTRGQAAGGSENCATPPTFGASGASHSVGYVPDPGSSAGTTRFLREDATWVAPGGVPVVQADQTGLGANVGATTLTTPAANGFYRISCYTVITRAATTSSTLPQCNVLYTDADSGSSELIMINGTTTANAVGIFGPYSSGAQATPATFYAKSGQVIQYQTNGYVSSGAISMQYAVHVRLEGPF